MSKQAKKSNIKVVSIKSFDTLWQLCYNAPIVPVYNPKRITGDWQELRKAKQASK